MSIGDRVRHPRLGDGTIIELCKYEMALVDFSDVSGVLVRIARLIDLEKIG